MVVISKNKERGHGGPDPQWCPKAGVEIQVGKFSKTGKMVAQVKKVHLSDRFGTVPKGAGGYVKTKGGAFGEKLGRHWGASWRGAGAPKGGCRSDKESTSSFVGARFPLGAGEKRSEEETVVNSFPEQIIEGLVVIGELRHHGQELGVGGVKDVGTAGKVRELGLAESKSYANSFDIEPWTRKSLESHPLTGTVESSRGSDPSHKKVL